MNKSSGEKSISTALWMAGAKLSGLMRQMVVSQDVSRNEPMNHVLKPGRAECLRRA